MPTLSAFLSCPFFYWRHFPQQLSLPLARIHTCARSRCSSSLTVFFLHSLHFICSVYFLISKLTGARRKTKPLQRRRRTRTRKKKKEISLPSHSRDFYVALDILWVSRFTVWQKEFRWQCSGKLSLWQRVLMMPSIKHKLYIFPTLLSSSRLDSYLMLITFIVWCHYFIDNNKLIKFVKTCW